MTDHEYRDGMGRRSVEVNDPPESAKAGTRTWTLHFWRNGGITATGAPLLIETRPGTLIGSVPVVEQAALDLVAWRYDQLVADANTAANNWAQRFRTIEAKLAAETQRADFAEQQRDILNEAVDKETQRADRLQKRVEELEYQYAGFEGMVALIRERLAVAYPASIFDGSSGDAGPVFVVALREALAKLDATP